MKLLRKFNSMQRRLEDTPVFRRTNYLKLWGRKGLEKAENYIGRSIEKGYED